MDLQKIIPYRKMSLKELLVPENKLMALIAIVLTALFFIGVIIYLIHGHHAYGVTREHPWGLLIAMYIFFVVSSTGLCIVGSFGDVFGFKDYMAVSKRAIFGSIITILSGFAVIAFEIGHPITMMIYNVLSPGLTSAIWWMGTLYGIYLTFMVIEFIFLMRNDMKNAKIFGLFGLLVGLAAHSNLGGVFGFLNARVVANGVFYPTYFILTAFITGIYLIFLMYGYKYRGKPFPEDVTKALINFMKIQGLLLAILMFFETWKMLTGVYGGMPERADVIMHILHTKSFWLGEVMCGMVIPFLLILKSKGTAIKSMVWASFIGMIGIFYMRYDLVHDAQLFPMQTLKIREYQLPPSFVDYFPSSTEMMIGFGGIGICLILYFLGTKLFDLDSMPEHH
ncbi:NrfD/PsrC family molybdoenzyme membrane anchor subunit [Hydrogenimonas sp.]|uniref:NrfD/PsrC family molybdoenzyme membrane anchor subunit n=1 Tax=Hydrogenimonas sp. TaxID=2231112 RepID=UPI0026121E2E|nr:NrfD/PsrC family molybdoenzyme membrane anchor subunit [Hydrogenimonas sp.]